MNAGEQSIHWRKIQVAGVPDFHPNRRLTRPRRRADAAERPGQIRGWEAGTPGEGGSTGPPRPTRNARVRERPGA